MAHQELDAQLEVCPMPKSIVAGRPALRSVTRPSRQDLRALVSFQLRQLANIYAKGSAIVYEREFSLTSNEWRLIALLEAAGELSLNRLATQAQFDRGLTSRIVTLLAERGFIDRAADSQDARSVVLSLTTAGRDLVKRVFPVAQTRNERLLSCLTKSERSTLNGILVKLTHQARVMLDLERERAAADSKSD
jgi:DNA-binding MarR family transcriptional regulator